MNSTESSQPPVVLITGAGTGIGKATANLFADNGWRVIATMRDPSKYTKEFTRSAFTVLPLDVTKPATIKTTLQEVQSKFGKLDAVINNAGYGLYGPFEMFPEQEVQQQYDVNFFGTVNVCREVIPLMRNKKQGTIVNISSMGGKLVIPYYGVYNSTKFAVEGFTEGLVYEVEPFGINVKMVEPGAINTDFYGRSQKTGSRMEYAGEYTEMVDKLWSQYGEAGKKGSSPEVVAQVIYKAATSNSKRLRYTAGFDAFSNVMLFKLLPHTWAMALVRMFTVNKR